MQRTQDDRTFGKAAGAGSEEPWKKRSPFSHLCNLFLMYSSRPTLTARLALAFTVEVCFQLKPENRQTEPTGRTCSDSNLLAMQVFITVEEVTDGGATGRACDDNNPHSLQLRWNLSSRHTGGGSRIL